MAGITILDVIEERLVLAFSQMNTSSGYNFDWSIVNEEDEAIGDFPRAIINPHESVADRETNVDTLAGLGSGDYTNEVYYTILVTGELPEFDDNANFKIRTVLRSALDDMKMYFGRNPQLRLTPAGEGACDNILYRSSQIEYDRVNDILSPARLRTTWLVIYAQDRKNPTQYASS
jgi:hypothetical protein